MDRGKVIKGLNCCCGMNMCFHGCPYHDASKKITECTSQLALEALDLLKEQEEQIKNRDESLEKARKEIEWLRGIMKEQKAVKPIAIKQEIFDEYYGAVACCPKCDCMWIMYMDNDMHYCPECGQAVKWDDRYRVTG